MLAEDRVRAFVAEQLAGGGPRRPQRLRGRPRRHPQLPAAAAARRPSTARCTGRVTRLTVLVALGTHAPMTEAQLAATSATRPATWPPAIRAWRCATTSGRTRRRSSRSAPSPRERVAELSGGLLRESVDVRLNRAVVEHDVALVVGPVFPHEVVGFSGGNKYFFPGVAGQEIIDLSHWLGALITSADIIGTRGITPVRALIDEAAALIPAETLRALRRRAVGHRRPARGRLRRRRAPPGRRPPTSPRRPTSATSTRRCGGCCR